MLRIGNEEKSVFDKAPKGWGISDLEKEAIRREMKLERKLTKADFWELLKPKCDKPLTLTIKIVTSKRPSGQHISIPITAQEKDMIDKVNWRRFKVHHKSARTKIVPGIVEEIEFVGVQNEAAKEAETYDPRIGCIVLDQIRLHVDDETDTDEE